MTVEQAIEQLRVLPQDATILNEMPHIKCQGRLERFLFNHQTKHVNMFIAIVEISDPQPDNVGEGNTEPPIKSCSANTDESDKHI